MRIVNAEGKVLYGRVIALCRDRGYPCEMPAHMASLKFWRRMAVEAVEWVNANTTYNLTLLKNGLDMDAPNLSNIEKERKVMGDAIDVKPNVSPQGGESKNHFLNS